MSEDDEGNPVARVNNEAFLAWLEAVPDPVERYSIATTSLEHHQEMVNRLSALRAEAVAAASAEDSVSAVAQRFGMSRQRAYQLLNDARARGAPAAAAAQKSAAAPPRAAPAKRRNAKPRKEQKEKSDTP